MNRGYALTLLALLASLLQQSTVNAQTSDDAAIMGRHWVVAFPDTTKNTFDARYPNNRYADKCFIVVYSPTGTTLDFRGNGVQRKDIRVAPGEFRVIDLMDTGPRVPSPIASESCKPTRGGVFQIDALDPVLVYQYMVTKFGTEAWTPLPVDAWGTEYIAAATPGEVGSDVSPGGEFDYNRRNKMFHAIIAVVAAFDNTRITIVPKAPIWSTSGTCPTTNILLNAGEVYQIESVVDTLPDHAGNPQPDFAGSTIFSTLPVGVISGNTRGQVVDERIGLGKNVFKNMMVEWLSPIEHHGTEFAYLPTWDDRRPTAPVPEDRRKLELVRVYYGSGSGAVVTASDSQWTRTLTQAGAVAFVEESVAPPAPVLYRSSVPAQAMMNTSAVVKYSGTTTGSGGYIGAMYDGWGTYSVELVPRRRWSSWAPVFAPSFPAGLVHYVQIVTDSAHREDVDIGGTRFIFNRGAVGTSDLVWGVMSLPAGSASVIVGRNGARFSGFVFGTLNKGGHEEYRPGATRPPGDDPSGVTPGGDLLHPSEYEEYLGIAYAYPLPSHHVVDEPSDSLALGVLADSCGVLRVQARSVGGGVGMMSADLADRVNAVISSVTPTPLRGASQATFEVRAIDRMSDASGTLVVTDRTGRQWSIPYAWTAPRIELAGGPVARDFGNVRVGDTVRTVLTLTNRSSASVTIARLTIDAGTANAVGRTVPFTLDSGEQTSVDVAIHPQPGSRRTNFVVGLACDSVSLDYGYYGVAPCISLSPLDFGTVDPGLWRFLPFRIANGGDDTLVLSSDPASVLTSIDPPFSLSSTERSRIAGTVLPKGASITVDLQFAPTTAGTFSDTIRVVSDSKRAGCSDLAVLTGSSVTTGMTREAEAGGLTLTIAPNPIHDGTGIRFTLDATTRARLAIYAGDGREVSTLVDEVRHAGEHVVRLDAAGLAAGIYLLRLTAGTHTIARSIVLVR